jgi:hypothetical protein
MTTPKSDEHPRWEGFDPDYQWALEFDAKLGALDPDHHPLLSYAQFEALKAMFRDPAHGVELRRHTRLIGKQMQIASELENEFALLVVALQAPDNAIAGAGRFLGLSARDRSEFLRDIVKSFSGKLPHWLSLIQGVEKEAVFRNDIAHGTWSFVRFPKGESHIERGWFLQRIKQRSNGSWYLRESEVSEAGFIDHQRRVEFLTQAVRAARFGFILRRRIRGHPVFFSDIRLAIAASPYTIRSRRRWYRELLDEYFPEIIE